MAQVTVCVFLVEKPSASHQHQQNIDFVNKFDVPFEMIRQKQAIRSHVLTRQQLITCSKKADNPKQPSIEMWRPQTRAKTKHRLTTVTTDHGSQTVVLDTSVSASLGMKRSSTGLAFVARILLEPKMSRIHVITLVAIDTNRKGNAKNTAGV